MFIYNSSEPNDHRKNDSSGDDAGKKIYQKEVSFLIVGIPQRG
jgi:hypothetical protein